MIVIRSVLQSAQNRGNHCTQRVFNWIFTIRSIQVSNLVFHFHVSDQYIWQWSFIYYLWVSFDFMFFKSPNLFYFMFLPFSPLILVVLSVSVWYPRKLDQRKCWIFAVFLFLIFLLRLWLCIVYTSVENFNFNDFGGCNVVRIKTLCPFS